MSMTSDASARQTALDVGGSFIVQAPAGSGKTELLTRRLLALLAVARAPEEILAITFTRKAAAEMKNRLLDALSHAGAVLRGEAAPPEEAYPLAGHALAAAALRRDREMGWSLLEHPARLSIQTIDSLCASLVARMPVLAGTGGSARPAQDAQSHYLEAARQTLAELESGGAGEDEVAALKRVLRHQDNDLARLERLIAAMLARREQWLPDMHALNDEPDRMRAWLEAQLVAQVAGRVSELKEVLGPGFQPALIPLGRYAAANLAGDTESHVVYLTDWESPMAYSVEALPAWLGVAELCLTQAGTARKRPDKNCGFPAEGKAEKAAFAEFLSGLTDAQAAALSSLRDLPPVCYSEDQWQTLAALMTVLRGAAARLWLRFTAQGEVDFTEIQARALMALGTPEAPTDLALALDYRLHHVLVDEFQDTNNTQWRLLEGLTAGWQEGDGRTLFLVGDPMQSIYLFRQAEVGLFLTAQRLGLGQLRLTPLKLSANFRSQAGIVDWVNDAFSGIFPEKGDVLSGAVPLNRAQATQPGLAGPAVRFHPFLDGANHGRDTLMPTDGPGLEARDAEAEQVARLVREAVAEGGSVAVLVRARSHLARIVPALSGIPYQAVEIDPLASRQYVADLLSLTRALLLPGDRVHWLSVLRAPWCGLTLSDLHALCGDDPETGIARLLEDEGRLAHMTEEGAGRARRAREVLLPLLLQHGRVSLRDRVERAWLQLGGESLLPDVGAREDVAAYLDLLEGLEEGGEFEPDDLAGELQKLYAAPQGGEAARVQIMTIHKAKGLEFDTVILPGLDRKPPHSPSALLQWQPVPGGLLIAPIHGQGEEKEPLYQYIAKLQAQKRRHEGERLLYVAATRAKSRLHLLAVPGLTAKGEVKFDSGSLLELLWPKLAGEIAPSFPPKPAEAAEATAPPALPLLRLPRDWRPRPPQAAPFVLPAPLAPELDDGAAADREAAAAGSVCHRLLQQIAEEGLEHWNAARLKGIAPFARRLAERQGVQGEAARKASERAMKAVAACLEDRDGRWVLGKYPVAKNEWSLTALEEAGPALHVIDRYFETEDGSRWLVDYKTDGPPEGVTGSALEAFLAARVEHHRPQLLRYARLLTALDERPVSLALYFASLPRLVVLES